MEFNSALDRQFYTVIQLSNNMFIDNDGTLVCKNAVLGKAGSQRYSARELGLDSSEIIVIHRPEREVFDEQSLSSLKGKALTLLHPDEDVSIENYQHLSKGIVLDVRREGNLIIGDIKVTDKEVIELIRTKEMVELSLGYDTKLVHDDGQLYQTEIVYNHVALVPKGRAEVARLIDEMSQTQTIRDRQFEEGELQLDVNEKQSAISKLLVLMGLKKQEVASLVDEYPDDVDEPDADDAGENTETDTLNDGDKTDPKNKGKENLKDEDTNDQGEEDENDEDEEEEKPKVEKKKTKDAQEENPDGEGDEEMNKEEVQAMFASMKDELLKEFEAKRTQDDNSALATFENLSFKDSEIKRFDFNSEYTKMLDELNPNNYEDFSEYVKVRKRYSAETTKENFQKLADEAFEGRNE